MKFLKNISVFGALALGAFSSAASAADYMRVNVPFSFVVAGQQFSPGQYVISQSESGVIRVQGAGKGALVISTPSAAAPLHHGSTLSFTNAQAQLNLTTVSQEGEVARAIPVRAVEQRTVTMSSR